MAHRVVGISLLAMALQPISICAQDNQPVKSASALPQAEIDKLIAQLGSESFSKREEATRKLSLREEALPALRRATRSADAEVRARAGRLLNDWHDELTKRELRRVLARCKNGEVDHFVMQMTHAKDAVKDDHWQGAMDLAEAVLKKAEFKAEEHSLSPRDMMKHGATTRESHPGVMVVDSRLVTDKVNITAHIVSAAVICGGPVKTGSHIVNSVLLANGDVQIGSHVVGGLIICDGNVEIGSHVVDSVIIARGTVRVTSHKRNSIIVQNEKKPLGILRFFDPAALGVDLGQAQGNVRIESVQREKRFAQAGVQKGDVIVSINGVKVNSPEACRVELRRRYWEGKKAILNLRRAGKPLEVTVKLSD